MMETVKVRLTKAEKEKAAKKEALRLEKKRAQEEKKAQFQKEKEREVHNRYIDDNPWYFKNEIFTSEQLNASMHGFIYIIKEVSSGKVYIGQKHLWTNKIKTVNGKRRKTKVESDWKDYYSSSQYINQKVESSGNSDFKRYILMFCPSDGSLNYEEMKLQMDLRVLESDLYLNGYIGGRISSSHIKSRQLLDYDSDMINTLYQNAYFGFKHD